MSNDLPNLDIETCLIWGEKDIVTPPHVFTEEFHKLMRKSELHHGFLNVDTAIWEHPKRFSEIVLKWLKDHNL